MPAGQVSLEAIGHRKARATMVGSAVIADAVPREPAAPPACARQRVELRQLEQAVALGLGIQGERLRAGIDSAVGIEHHQRADSRPSSRLQSEPMTQVPSAPGIAARTSQARSTPENES